MRFFCGRKGRVYGKTKSSNCDGIAFGYTIACKIIEEGLNVREVEKLVKSLEKPQKEKEKKTREDESLTVIFQNLEDRMKTIMGTKVSINRKDKNKGRIEIEYYSPAELERIVDLIESIKSNGL